jgi:ferredoxin
VCFHCVDSCPSDALKFSFRDIENEGEEKKQIGLDIKKRRVFHAVGAALVAVPLIKATEQYKQDVGGAAEGPALHNPLLIRPPGAVDESEFLQRCIRCAECMKVCPTNGLQPATLEAGIEGMWTPILVPRIGYCEYYCTLCGQVCPTGAIQQLDVDTKIKTIIGTAFFDFNRCLPYAFGVDCIVCEEHCPTSPKAIWFERERRSVRGEAESLAAQTDPYGSGDEQVWLSPTEQAPADDAADEYDAYESQDYSDPYGSVGSGDPEYVLKPKIDLDLCIGCGICEKVCVVADKPAVYITAVGESRSNTNRITFEGSYEGY